MTADIYTQTQALAEAVGALVAVVGFVWGRLEVINNARKREIERCTRQREQDRIQGRERRATLLAMIRGVLAVLHRHAPHAPEIAETNQLLADFYQRERIEAEQDEAA